MIRSEAYVDSLDLKELKKTLRKATLAKRKDLAETSPELFGKYNQSIIATLKNTREYKDARVIMCFISFQDEVETHQFIKEALAEGKKIFVPYIITDEKIMVPAEITDFENDLEPGYYNILAPREDRLAIKDKNEIDLVVTPGVVFDHLGYRIGYGAGFYDRFFSQLDPAVPKIALGFSLQQTDEPLPRDEYDIQIDKLITENGITVFEKE